MTTSYVTSICIDAPSLTPLTGSLRISDEAVPSANNDILSCWRAITSCDDVYTTPEASTFEQNGDSYSVDWLSVCGVSVPRRRLILTDLGFTPEESLALHLRLKPFEEDWDAPGMEAYDEL